MYESQLETGCVMLSFLSTGSKSLKLFPILCEEIDSHKHKIYQKPCTLQVLYHQNKALFGTIASNRFDSEKKVKGKKITLFILTTC